MPSTVQDKEAENIAKAAQFIRYASWGALMPKHKHKPGRVVLTTEGHHVVKFHYSHFSLFRTTYSIYKGRPEEFFDTNLLLGNFC